MEIIKHTNLKLLRNSWTDLYNSNAFLNPLQSFDFFETYYKNTRIPIKSFKQKLEIYEVVDNQKTQLILPLIKKTNTYQSVDTLDYYDIVYNHNIEDKTLLRYLNAIKKYINKPIIFNHISESSKLYNLLKAQNIKILDSVECAKINISNSYDEYYNSLSKSTRQNIRTAYNRLNKDLNNPKMELQITTGQINVKLINKLKVLYLKRKATKNKGFISKVKCILKRFYEPVSKTCGSLEDGFTSILFINNQIASFMQGLKSKDTTIIIPRLVLNDKFARYSTGILLINETIKRLINENISNCLDLAIGNENYKFVMGGVSHINYNFEY